MFEARPSWSALTVFGHRPRFAPLQHVAADSSWTLPAEILLHCHTGSCRNRCCSASYLSLENNTFIEVFKKLLLRYLYLELEFRYSIVEAMDGG